MSPNMIISPARSHGLIERFTGFAGTEDQPVAEVR